MKMAEKFNIPVLTLIDTPGAYPGLEAEERDKVKLLQEIFLRWHVYKHLLFQSLLEKVLLEVH